MNKTALIYGSKGGNTEYVAKRIYKELNDSNIDFYCLEDFESEKVKKYSRLILGVSTVGSETWNHVKAHNTWDKFFVDIKNIDLSGLKVAIFGLGNQVLWPDHFCDDMAVVKDKFETQGAEIIGKWPVEGYDHNESKAQEGDFFIGLAVDEDQQDEMTDERVKNWVAQIKGEF